MLKCSSPPSNQNWNSDPFGSPLNLVGFAIKNINVVSLYPTPFSKWGETCSQLTKTKRNIVIGLFSGCIILYLKPFKIYRGVLGNYGHPVCMDKSRKRKEGHPLLKENQNVKAWFLPNYIHFPRNDTYFYLLHPLTKQLMDIRLFKKCLHTLNNPSLSLVFTIVFRQPGRFLASLFSKLLLHGSDVGQNISYHQTTICFVVGDLYPHSQFNCNRCQKDTCVMT